MAKNKSEFEETQEEDVGAQFENAEDGLVVDLSNVEAQKFEVLPKGTYDGIIEDVEYQISKSASKPMWNMKIGTTTEDLDNTLDFFVATDNWIEAVFLGSLSHIDAKLIKSRSLATSSGCSRAR